MNVPVLAGKKFVGCAIKIPVVVSIAVVPSGVPLSIGTTTFPFVLNGEVA